jgi:hypothetical protein
MTTATDHAILRDLGRRYAEAADPTAQAPRYARWRELNALRPGRPVLFVNELPWHELAAADESLRGRIEDPFLAGVELELRKKLYQWRHLRGDMVLSPFVVCPKAFRDSGWDGGGSHIVRTTVDGGADHYEPCIHSLEDVARIRVPVIERDDAETARRQAVMEEIFAGILPVVVQGIVHEWFAPWDFLIKWYGINQLYLDMVDQPGLVHAAIGRMMDVQLARLDQLEAQGLLDVGDGNNRVGSGGLGITDQLPTLADPPAKVSARHLWGSSTGQIFSGASPRMHEEFCLRYELRWLERFGITCYGCCEPLHDKLGILKAVPRLRRISISPWADTAKAAARIGTGMVFSLKPSPSPLASDVFDLAAARQGLRTNLEASRGCRVEVILKDVSTIRGDPDRLVAWMGMAQEEIDRVAQGALVAV